MLFRKTTAEELLKMFSALSDEEKAKFLEGVKGPTTGEQVEKAEEDIAEKGEDSQTAEDRVDESMAMQEKADGDEDSQDANDRVDESEGEEAAAEPEPEAVTEEPSPEEVQESEPVTDNRDEVLKLLGERLEGLEQRLKELDGLKAQMEEYISKQAESFGYRGHVAGCKKDIQDMSADELKQNILQGK